MRAKQLLAFVLTAAFWWVTPYSAVQSNRDAAPSDLEKSSIFGPFVDPDEAYPHQPTLSLEPLQYRSRLPATPEQLFPNPQPLRLTPGEVRKPNAPQLSSWVDQAAQTTSSLGNMPEPQYGFAGLGIDPYVKLYPPDTVGDASLTHYIQAVNISVGIYELPSGNPLYEGSFNNFFSGPQDTPCEDNHRGDPVVVYDSYVNRWLVTDFAWDDFGSGFYQCLAVSQGPDPINDGWYFYALRADTGNFEFYLNDYPKVSVWHDGWYMTANMFEMKYPGTGFGVRVWALDRQAMINGEALQEVHFDLCTENDCASLLPAHDGLAQAPTSALPPNYLLAAIPQDRLHIWKFSADFDNPLSSTLTGPTSIPVTPFATAANIPQPGTPIQLDSLSSRLMMQLQYRYLDETESLWANHTVASSGYAGIRWYEIRKPGEPIPLLAQQSTYQPDDNHRWMGSGAVDQDGNYAIGYSISSESMYPSIRVAGRLAPETTGQLTQSEIEMINGTGSQVVTHRWGDYSAMTVGPDGCTFYYTNEYYQATGSDWHTWVTAFGFPSCGQPKGRLVGVVIDAETSQPLADVPVIAVTTNITLTTITDTDGVFSLDLVEGSYSVTAGPKPPGYPVSTQATGVLITENTTTTIDLELIPYPALSIDTISLFDPFPDGNENHTPEPGERDLQVEIGLHNAGSVSAVAIESRFTSTTPGISITSDQSPYPDIPPGQSENQSNRYFFDLAPDMPCGTELQFSQEVTDSLQVHQFNFTMDTAITSPRRELIANDVERGTLLWETAGVNNTWGIISKAGLPSPSHAWSDSPVGNYKDDTNASLISTTFNLSGKRNVQVEFAIQYSIETGWDYLYLEYSLDDGQTWSSEPLAIFSGYQGNWIDVQVPAPALADQAKVKLRFRLLSDTYITYDGVTLDNIKITFEPYNCDYEVALPPATPVPLAPMGGELFWIPLPTEVLFEWLPGASGASITGYRLYIDGVLTVTLPGTQTSAAIQLQPGYHRWSVEAYNEKGTSPQSPDTSFLYPFTINAPIITKP